MFFARTRTPPNSSMKPVPPPSSSSRKTTVLRAKPGVGSRGVGERFISSSQARRTPETHGDLACFSDSRPPTPYTRTPSVLSGFSAEKRVPLACCRVFPRENAFIRCAVAFVRRKACFSGVRSRFSGELSRFSGVLSRLSGEKRVHPACCRVYPASCHVHPACCRVYPPKNAFIRRAVAFFSQKTRSSGVLSRFSAKKRVHPACCHVFQPKNAFLRRKTCFFDEHRVLPTKNAFIRARSGQPGWLVLSSKRDGLASAHAAPPVRRGLPANGERLSNIHLPAASFITSSSPRRAGVTITIDHA